MRDISEKNVVEKIQTHSLCSVTFSLKWYLFKIKWKNIVERGRPQMAVWRMHIACCIAKATNKHAQFV